MDGNARQSLGTKKSCSPNKLKRSYNSR